MSRFKTFFSKLREKHDLTYSDEGSYDEKWSLKVSVFNMIMVVALYSIILLFLVFLLFKYTNLKAVFVNVNSEIDIAQVNENAAKIDSLYQKSESTIKYWKDLKRILDNEPFNDSIYSTNVDTLPYNYQPDFIKNEEDSLLRDLVENNFEAPVKEHLNIAFFYAPVKGIVSRSIDIQEGHYGIDVSVEKDAPIQACLEGVIIYSGWDSDVGNVVIIQHPHEILSVYKHCSKIIKKMGDIVQSGDPIAIAGNTGQHTSGPHLHFELWEKGKILNPQDYINFER